MPFLTFSKIDVQFVGKGLTWRSYTTAKALSTTKRVKLLNKKEFAKGALDEESKTFVVYVAFLHLTPGIQPDKATQIAFLLTKESRIPDEYLDFANIFFKEKALVLLEHTKLNEHAIDLENSEQPPYGPIIA